MSLKTLKDIKGIFHIVAIDERTPRSNRPIAKASFNEQEIMSGYEMTCKGIFIKVEHLRQEAIKWIKEDKEVLERLHEDDKGTWEIALRRWKERFNIKESELL